MSYARFSDDCNVYIFITDDSTIECCACALSGLDQPWKRFPVTPSGYTDLIEHLEEHKRYGHTIPDDVTDDIAADRQLLITMQNEFLEKSRA